MKTGSTEHVDLSALTVWFASARPGAWLIYALGDLAADRGQRYRERPTTVLDAVAEHVMAWQRSGHVALYQRRSPPHGFAYVVQRRATVIQTGGRVKDIDAA